MTLSKLLIGIVRLFPQLLKSALNFFLLNIQLGTMRVPYYVLLAVSKAKEVAFFNRSNLQSHCTRHQNGVTHKNNGERSVDTPRGAHSVALSGASRHAMPQREVAMSQCQKTLRDLVTSGVEQRCNAASHHVTP